MNSVTSDDKAFIRREEAEFHTNEMINGNPEEFVDTTITTWYPDDSDNVFNDMLQTLDELDNIRYKYVIDLIKFCMQAYKNGGIKDLDGICINVKRHASFIMNIDYTFE